MELSSLLLGLSLLATPAQAQIVDNALIAPEQGIVAIEPELRLKRQIDASESELKAYAIDTANKYGVSSYELVKTIENESGWKNEQSGIIDSSGQREDSHGVCQLHAPSNPAITREQMYDPYWCIDYMAQEFVAGKACRWTEWRKLTGKTCN